MKKIIFGGFYSTGGSAVGDILSECSNVYRFPVEFRIVKEYRGLLDLGSNIYSNDPERVDLAIKDFLWLVSKLNIKTSWFRNGGLDYGMHTGNNLIKETEKYIKDIIDYKYPMEWYYYDFNRNIVNQISRKFIKKITGNNIRTEAFFTNIDRRSYYDASNNYIDRLLQLAMSNNQRDFVAIQNAVPLTEYSLFKEGLRYFNESKIVIVDRDPRDVYLSIYESRYLPLKQSDNRVDAFINFYLSLRKDLDVIKLRKDVLYVRFEDLCWNYDNELKRIFCFLNIDISSHEQPKKSFDPEISRKNSRLFEGNCEYTAINKIEKNLKKYLY
jgi:hypothetical protein